MRILSLLATAGAFCLGLLWTSAPAASGALSPPAGSSVRSPVPETVETKRLRLLMVGLAQDMDRINTGLWHEDYDLMQQGAAALAPYPGVTSRYQRRARRAHGTASEHPRRRWPRSFAVQRLGYWSMAE